MKPKHVKQIVRRKQTRTLLQMGISTPTSLKEPLRYRVFLSYSHEDEDLVSRIAQILTENGLEPMYDRNFVIGRGFDEQIASFITNAHIFVPVLTPSSATRPWVHQEIGYSMALNIPVLPIAVGQLPGEMIQRIHALRAQHDQLDALRTQLTRDRLEALIERHAEPENALYICAEHPELRAALLARYADDVASLGYRAVLRQKGALSSLHIPTETVGHAIWKQRYGKVERGDEHCRLQRRERIALGKHAETAGCKLIINPYIPYKKYGRKARIIRLRCLLRFLQGMTDARCQVAITEKMDHNKSLTILGNWFAAESVSAEIGKGYRQTIFTRHAPTVVELADNYDAEFEELMADSKVRKRDSRRHAIRVIEQITNRVGKTCS